MKRTTKKVEQALRMASIDCQVRASSHRDEIDMIIVSSDVNIEIFSDGSLTIYWRDQPKASEGADQQRSKYVYNFDATVVVAFVREGLRLQTEYVDGLMKARQMYETTTYKGESTGQPTLEAIRKMRGN